MKKTLLILVVLALLVPSAAFATEFSLGGFIKLDAFWDSTQEGKNMNTPILRDNNPNFQHGRLHFTSQGSRFNFTIKGPDLWGAKTTGFIEMDFDSNTDVAGTAAVAAGNNTLNTQSASNNYVPRLRHAMFRLNWPETELLFGQYWSMFCEYYPESAQDGPMQGTGCPTARLPQIRVTQKFAGAWNVAFLVGDANPIGANLNNYTLAQNGYSAEAPQIQGKIQYEADLWGKAPFYGKPRGFTAQVTGGWQRATGRPGQITNGVTSDADGNALNSAVVVNQRNHQYLDAWMLQGTLFIPVLPTYSANLAGSASLSTQWYVAQGAGAFGFTGQNSLFKFIGNFGGLNNNFYDQQLLQSFGGYIQGQYWFNNEWFMNIAWGMSRIYGLPDTGNVLGGNAGVNGARAFGADQFKLWQEIDATLWYRPIAAMKFGLQYSYGRTDWVYNVQQTLGTNNTNVGEAHRVEFVALWFF